MRLLLEEVMYGLGLVLKEKELIISLVDMIVVGNIFSV